MAPLLGVTDAPEIEKNIENALKDATTLQKAGFDSIIIENNYDLPHDIFVKPNVVSSFTYVANEIAKEISIPIGICVLWNDFYSALSIAKLINASYVRVPVFVDNVKTNYGVVTGDASAVTNFRKQISAENIAIFTDIQVKHSELLNVRPLSESAKEAIKKDSDGLIVTGKWTGDAPKASDLEEVREAADKFPILIGSGADIDNLQTLTKYADGIIIGTAIKEGESLTKEQHVNLKGFDKRISLEKAEKFREKFLRCVSIG